MRPFAKIPAFTFFAAFALSTVAHVGTMAIVGWRFGATVEEVSFFRPVLIRFRYGGVQYRIGLIPMGGYAKSKGDRDEPKSAEELLFAADMEPPGFNDLHPLERVVIAASGCAALVMLSALCLGPWASVRSLGRGFVQITPFAPWTPTWVPGGKELAGRFVSLLRDGPFRVVLGVVAAKLAAINLLPVPPLNGGMIITCLLGWKKGLPERIRVSSTYIGLLLLLITLGFWILEFAAVFRRMV